MTATSWRRNLLICLCLAATIVVVYSPVRHLGFVNYDDDEYVATNPHVQGGLTLRGLVWAFTTNHAANWHPLTWLSHMLDWQLWGGRADAHHLVNVLLHVANALLLFGVLSRMTASALRSALVAGLFALHPLHVESVAWVSERKDVLSTCFWLLTMWAYVRYVEQPSGGRYLSTLGLYALGLMAKPMVVTLPFVLVLLDYWPLGRTPWAKSAASENVPTPPIQLIKEKLPFLALGAMSCALTYWAQRGGGAVVSLVTVPMGMRIANALLSYVGYMGKAFWPVGLAIFYPLPARLPVAALMIAGAGLVGMTAAMIWWAPRAPWFVTGWFWYLGTLVPVLGLVQVGAQSMADRYTYIPSIGLFIILCWSVPSRAMKRQNVKVITCVAVGAALAACMVLSRVQVGYWKDGETLFRHALDVTRGNWLAHYGLGVALEKAGRTQDAIGHYEQALRIRPDYMEAHNNLGNALGKAGRIQEAIGHYEQALRIRPDDAIVHYNMGRLYAADGKLREAIAQYKAALRLKPDYAKTYNNLAWLLATSEDSTAQDHEQAIQLATRASELTAGKQPDYLDTLAVAYAAADRFPEAVTNAQKAIELARSGRQPELAGQIESRLKLYRAGRAYYESVRVTSPQNP